MSSGRSKIAQNNMEAWPWIQRDRYLKEVCPCPDEHPEGSEAYEQFAYNPRTKKGRELIAEIKRNQALSSGKKSEN